MPKSWRDKLADDKDLPKVVKIPPKLQKSWGKGTFVIVRPRDVDAVMKRVPPGKVITIKEICQKLAKKHGVTVACPITTGIFAWIAAHAAEEAAMNGEKKITPYWRTLKGEGELNPKYPGGIERCKKLLEEEGHTVIIKGKRTIVVKPDLVLEVDSFISFTSKAIQTPSVLKKLDRQSKLASTKQKWTQKSATGSYRRKAK